MSQVDIGRALLLFVAFLFSICFHEFAHAWMAARRGDNTARLMGRLTLNPVAHADIFGTVILPLMGLFGFSVIGWAKPVPVNMRNLIEPKNDMFLVAAAGPGSNLLLALVGAILLGLTLDFQVSMPAIGIFLRGFILVNLSLCLFNLIPLHPLDGGKILGRFLPAAWNYKLEEMQTYSTILLLVLFVTGALRYILYPVYYMNDFMLRIAEVFVL